MPWLPTIKCYRVMQSLDSVTILMRHFLTSLGMSFFSSVGTLSLTIVYGALTKYFHNFIQFITVSNRKKDLSFIEWGEVNMSIKMLINMIYTCYLLTTPVPAVNRVLNYSLIMKWAAVGLFRTTSKISCFFMWHQ